MAVADTALAKPLQLLARPSAEVDERSCLRRRYGYLLVTASLSELL